MNIKNRWYRLDNSAMIYPLVITLKSQSLFRIGVCLNEEVDKDHLSSAVNSALVRYPFFKVELKRGFFRHYLDENTLTPIVEEDDGALLKILNFRHNRNYLFRVTYYKKRIFMDYFHGLCDGTGALEFLKTVIYYYFKLKNEPITKKGIITLSSIKKPGEIEDAFQRYYKKVDLIEGTKKMAGGYAFGVKSKQFSGSGFGLIQAIISTESLLQCARKYQTTITVFISALAMLSVAQNEYYDTRKENLVAFIPVNLRKQFPSDTLGNFTVFAKCIIPFGTEKTLEAFIASIKASLEEQLSTKELQTKLSFTSLMDKLPILRYLPLCVKAFISKVGRISSSKPKQTMIISNLGSVNIEGENKIDHFMFNLNCSAKTPINMGIISYKDKTVISFTRKIISTDIERFFCTKLAEITGDVSVLSNFREDCDVL